MTSAPEASARRWRTSSVEGRRWSAFSTNTTVPGAAYHVLMVAPTPFFADRGCHVRILGEIRALQEEGCDITLCTYHNGRDIPGIRTVRIPCVPWYNKLAAGPSNHKYYLDLLLLWKSLATALRRRPDVIHAHLHEGAAIGRFLSVVLRRPLVFDYQGSLTDELASHEYARRDGLAELAHDWHTTDL